MYTSAQLDITWTLYQRPRRICLMSRKSESDRWVLLWIIPINIRAVVHVRGAYMCI